MMKTIYAVLTATVLAFATLGQSYALDIADSAALEKLVTDSNKDDGMQVAEYADAKGEKLYIEGDAGKVEKFDRGMQMFAGVGTSFPEGTAIVVMSTVPDEDGDFIVMLFKLNGEFTGVKYIGKSIRDAVLDYVEAGV